MGPAISAALAVVASRAMVAIRARQPRPPADVGVVPRCGETFATANLASRVRHRLDGYHGQGVARRGFVRSAGPRRASAIGNIRVVRGDIAYYLTAPEIDNRP